MFNFKADGFYQGLTGHTVSTSVKQLKTFYIHIFFSCFDDYNVSRLKLVWQYCTSLTSCFSMPFAICICFKRVYFQFALNEFKSDSNEL